MEMARIGPGVAGGCDRQTLTDADGEGRSLLKGWCEAEGLAVTVDRMGNMFARRPGSDDTLEPVLIGSHLDTQPTGGKYDGVLGVLGALEAVRTLNAAGTRTRRPIEVVNWTNEEGSRFAPAMLGSGVFVGVHRLDWAHDRVDADGRRLGDELARIGWMGTEEPGRRGIHAYYELHIEQGPVLEDAGLEIGVVTHGQGVRWLQVTLTGREGHAGTTPMAGRADAGLGMARVIGLAGRIAWRHAPHAVGTVGHCDVRPNSRNTIPGRAVLTVDFRHPNREALADMEARLRQGVAEIAGQAGLSHEIEEVGGFDPVTFDPACAARVRDAAGRLGYRHRDLVSGAGHDACWISRVAPAAMVMCPCKGGLSHNEAEEITREWAAAGADVLLHAAAETAGVA